jgi:phosphoribosylamine--glycine ligase
MIRRLAAGITDKLEILDIPVVGPTKDTARLEWSKSFTRQVIQDNGIAGNPEFQICKNMNDIKNFLSTHNEVAVKPDVLTGGKGVKITGEHLHSIEAIEEYAAQKILSDGLVLLEERLIGQEFTLQAFTDGIRIEVMPLVRDFKRAYDGDEGPNTGSMGSFSCSDHGMPDLSNDVIMKGTQIMKDTIRAIGNVVGRYKGILYGGFMKTKKGVYLIEYNVRFGDPEAINVLTILKDPLTDIGFGITSENLPRPEFQRKATVCVYLVPTGYPLNPTRDKPIFIKEPIQSELYYASVYFDDGQIKTTGSRAIALLAKSQALHNSREIVYRDAPRIKGDLYYRTDIAKGL